MPSILIFSAEDIGSNYRILRHAKSFATLPNSKVQILGPDISSLPKELEKLPNIDHHYIYLWEFPYFLDYLFFPIKILILLFQILIFSLKSNIKYEIILFPSISFFTYFGAKFLSKIFKAKTVIDISLFKHTNVSNSTMFSQILEKIIIKKADYRICSTRSIQIILKCRALDSIVIHDPPGTQFSSQKVHKTDVLSFLNVNKNSILISVPLPIYDSNFMNWIISECNSLNDQKVESTFVLFGSSKIEKTVEEMISNDSSMQFTSLRFIPMNTDAYANILSCSDFAILLTGTRSGLDYSPQLTELVSSGLPTLVAKGGCMSDVIINGENGFIYNSKDELVNLLSDILIHKKADLIKMKESMKLHQTNWEDEWKTSFLPILSSLKKD